MAVVVVGLIALFVYKSSVSTEKRGLLAAPKNQFTERIEKEITELSKLPDNKFCKDTYDGVKFIIDDYYKPHPPQHPYGRLGKTQLENDQLKENFSKNLYSVYADKFIKQAFYVFGSSEWKIENIAFIRSECLELRKSNFLEKGSPVDKSFSKIQQILLKYDEINNFIETSNNFSSLDANLSSKFPFADLKIKISRIDTYKRNKLDNIYVNKCARLHNKLDSTKRNLVDTYLKYLEVKISKWMGFYYQFKFSTFNEYNNMIYDPLKTELDDFANNCNYYHYSYDSNRYNALQLKLKYDRQGAYKHIRD
ncbi:hypothetical protein FEDK69T_18750 [Flavobacterium enshiense DK69]|nr:hypothetical protein FEDK69T_18750 [Flavobacterium enshiense DK69]